MKRIDYITNSFVPEDVTEQKTQNQAVIGGFFNYKNSKQDRAIGVIMKIEDDDYVIRVADGGVLARLYPESKIYHGSNGDIIKIDKKEFDNHFEFI